MIALRIYQYPCRDSRLICPFFFMTFFTFFSSVHLPIDLVVLTLVASAAGLEAMVVSEAQTSALCIPSFSWADNQDHQSSCLIAADIMAPCTSGSYIVPALTNFTHYDLPDGTSANLCSCSWLAYNLFSACSACQGYEGQIVPWAAYSAGCASFLSTSFYPSSVTLPNNIPIPKWAITNPMTWPNSVFDMDQAKQIADQDQPDVLPPGSKKLATRLPTGVIAGIATGGVALLILVLIIAFWLFCLRKKKAASKRATVLSNFLNPKSVREPAPRQPFMAGEISSSPYIHPFPSPSLSGITLTNTMSMPNINPQHIIVPFDIRNVPSSQHDFSGNVNHARSGSIGPTSAHRQLTDGQVSMSVKRAPINPPDYDQATSQEASRSRSVHKSPPTTPKHGSLPTGNREHTSSSRRTTIDNIDPRAVLAAEVEGGRVIPLRDARMDRKKRKRATLDA